MHTGQFEKIRLKSGKKWNLLDFLSLEKKNDSNWLVVVPSVSFSQRLFPRKAKRLCPIPKNFPPQEISFWKRKRTNLLTWLSSPELFLPRYATLICSVISQSRRPTASYYSRRVSPELFKFHYRVSPVVVQLCSSNPIAKLNVLLFFLFFCFCLLLLLFVLGF